MRGYVQQLLEMSSGVRRFVISEALLGVGIGLFSLVLNLHLLAVGLDEEKIGEITSIGMLIVGAAAIPTGLLANRTGRKKILVTGLIMMGLGYTLFGLGTSYMVFLSAQVILSLGISSLVTSEIQLLFHYSRSKKEETQAYSILFAVFTLFTGVGTLLGGFIPNWLGGVTSIYQSSVLVAAGFFFLAALLRGILLPKENLKLANEEGKVVKKPPTTRGRLGKPVWIFSIYTFISGITFAFIGPFNNVIIKFRFDWSDERVSVMLTATGVFLFLGSLLTPYVLERWGIRRTYFRVYLLNILLAWLLFFTIPILLFVFFWLFRNGSFMLLNNLIESQAMSAVDEQERNLFAGIRSVSRSVGTAISTYLSGVILAMKNYQLPFLLTAGVLLFGYLYFIIWVRPILEDKLQEDYPNPNK
ncbi:MFS transporter [Microaerobacter geothermalis]|uniref:MFS transporter n=1 Tax=Microaerobacter geothermalis TaxID=674972 RepID=UPI001F2C514A|nr:MFS transporter [Microaerobacter geothermalis]MCF6093434.1 MFS transporter [Microaerobacter geothermalis]